VERKEARGKGLTLAMEKIKFKRLEDIPIDQIEVSPTNVRHTNAAAGIEELGSSIDEISLIQPVVVIDRRNSNEKYRLIVGQRRYRAFQELGKTKIPALVIEPLGELGEKIVSLGENIQRRDLPYQDTIDVVSALYHDAKGKPSERVKKVAAKLGLPPRTISNYLSYELIPKEVRELVNEGKLPAGTASRITSAFLPDTEKVIRLAKSATRLTSAESRRAVDLAKENPKAKIDDVVEEAKRPKEVTYQIIFPVTARQYQLLQGLAARRKTDVISLVKDHVLKLLSEEEGK
jgi:ParB family chromosome partitioning protein